MPRPRPDGCAVGNKFVVVCVAFRKSQCRARLGRGRMRHAPRLYGGSSRLPLQGIRVLDLSRILAGPFASMLLGDYGAEVWKVEHPLIGDDTRTWGPPFDTVSNEQSAYFLAVNRNKKSCAIDFKKADGLDLVKELALKADVLIENFLPGKLEMLGLGYTELRRANPGLVYCSLSGYGSVGPLAHAPAYDVMVSARCGLMGITGEPDGDPVKPGVALIDISTGLLAHGSICAALYSREKDGRGQLIQTSLYETGVACMANVASSYLIAGEVGRRHGTAHASVAPYQAFRSRDGHIVIGALNDGQFQRFATAVMGDCSLAQDPKFASNAARVKNRKELVEQIEAVMREHTNMSISTLCESADIPYGPISTVEDVFTHPHTHACKMVERVEHPTAGPISLVGIPVKFPDSPLSIRLPPPILGQHTYEVLTSVLGCTAKRVDQLCESKVIAAPNIFRKSYNRPSSGI